jgi:hypothetical protein
MTLNGTSWTMIVHKTQIANRGRLSNGQVTVAGWSHLPLISASGPFRNLKALIIQTRLELDEKCLKDTYSNYGSADRLVVLLQQFGASCC